MFPITMEEPKPKNRDVHTFSTVEKGASFGETSSTIEVECIYIGVHFSSVTLVQAVKQDVKICLDSENGVHISISI